MRNYRLFTGILALSAVAAANLALGQRSIIEPHRDPAGGKPPTVEYWGHGKGELVLPVSVETGAMSGVLIDNDGAAAFRLDAQLTGCMPGSLGTGTYWFGGLEGRIQKLAQSPPDIGSTYASYRIDGMWALDKHMNGTFHAHVMEMDTSGRWSVAGNIYGRFVISSPTTLPAGISDIGYAGRTPPKYGKSPFDDARAKGLTPVRDVAAVPRKGGKGKFGHPKSKGDASALIDAGSMPPPPLVGSFNLRFTFYK